MKAPRKITSFALTALAVCLLAIPAAASDLWLHVVIDDHSAGDDAANVTLNLPISLIEAAVPMLGETEIDADHFQFEDQHFTGEDLRAFLAAVQDAPDAEFVRVETQNETVAVSKDRDFLLVRTLERSEDGTDVDIRMPMAVVDALSQGMENGRLDLAAAVRALASFGEGELATIHADDTQVRIWVDSRPGGR